MKVRWYTVLSSKAEKMLQDIIHEDYKFLHEAAAEAAKVPEKRKWSQDEDSKSNYVDVRMYACVFLSLEGLQVAAAQAAIRNYN